jgi:hypothetical protein
VFRPSVRIRSSPTPTLLILPFPLTLSRCLSAFLALSPTVFSVVRRWSLPVCCPVHYGLLLLCLSGLLPVQALLSMLVSCFVLTYVTSLFCARIWDFSLSSRLRCLCLWLVSSPPHSPLGLIPSSCSRSSFVSVVHHLLCLAITIAGVPLVRRPPSGRSIRHGASCSSSFCSSSSRRRGCLLFAVCKLFPFRYQPVLFVSLRSVMPFIVPLLSFRVVLFRLFSFGSV